MRRFLYKYSGQIVVIGFILICIFVAILGSAMLAGCPGRMGC